MYSLYNPFLGFIEGHSTMGIGPDILPRKAIPLSPNQFVQKAVGEKTRTAYCSITGETTKEQLDGKKILGKGE